MGLFILAVADTKSVCAYFVVRCYNRMRSLCDSENFVLFNSLDNVSLAIFNFI